MIIIYKKFIKKGFTLVELMISISLLSFVILMATLLFDRAIHVSPKLKQNITDSSKSYSAMENAMFTVRKNPTSIASSTVFTNINLKIGNIQIKDVKGHLISYDGSKIKYDGDVEKTDKLFTFIGDGHKESEISKVLETYIENPASSNSRFRFFPIDKSEEKISAHYKAENKGIFQLMRTRFFRTPVNDKDLKILYLAYAEPAEIKNDIYFGGQNIPHQGSFEYLGNSLDGKENIFDFSNHLNLLGYSTNKEAYLNSIDKSYASTAITLNRNGHVSPTVMSFSNTKTDKQNAVHLIGLPYKDNLFGFYDYNLLISRSNTNMNNYYSLYNREGSKKPGIDYPDPYINEASDRYTISWKVGHNNHDVTNLLGINGNPQLFLNDGFFPKKEIQITHESEFVKIKVPHGPKSYGASAYYDANEQIAEFEIPNRTSKTFFAKFNLENFNEEFLQKKETSPFAIFHSNWNLNTGTSKNSNGGFVIYADKDGNLYRNSSSENKKLEYNIKKEKNTNYPLYQDISDAANFESLEYNPQINTGKRDGRENFQIFALNLKANNSKLNVDVYALFNKKEVINGSTVVVTNPIRIDSFTLENFNSNNKIIFGGKPYKGNDGDNDIALENPLNLDKPAVEVSDLLLYNKNLMDVKLNNDNSRNLLYLTMEYLYRKYLTEDERKSNGYDAYFMKKY